MFLENQLIKNKRLVFLKKILNNNNYKTISYQALLLSNVISPNSEQCVEFYYYQDPSTVGSLNIYAKLTTQANVSGAFPLWTEPFVHDSAGIPSWQLAQVSLGHGLTSQQYQVVFEEYVEANKPGYYFNIYIDDVLIRDESCLPPGDCDFESGFCKIFDLFYN